MRASLAHLDIPRSHFTQSTCQSLPSSKLWYRCPCRLLSLRRATTLRRLNKLAIFHLGSAGPKRKEMSISSIVRIIIVCQRDNEIRQRPMLALLLPTDIQRKRPRRTKNKIWTKFSKQGKVRQVFAYPVRVKRPLRNPQRSWTRKSAKFCHCKWGVSHARHRNQIVVGKP